MDTKHRVRRVLFVLFFVTGFSGLIYEVLWVRMFTLVFGATVFAVSTVLTAFFAGLALGSYVFGRVVDRFGKPLLLYGLLEVGIGAYAFFLPSFLSETQAAYAGVSENLSASFYVLSLVRFLICFLLLLLPTTLMGATLPVLSRFMVEARERVGKDIGYLYAINTIGATLGCVVTGFLLIKFVGISRTHNLAVILNLAVGATVLAMHRMAQAVPPSASPSQRPRQVASTGEGDVPEYSSSLILLVLGAFALSGAAALAYEVLWTRVLAVTFHSTTYSFTLMLSTFLCGLALGSYLYGRYFHRQRRLVLFFGAIQILIGLYALGLIPFFRILPDLASEFIKPVEGSWWAKISLEFLLSFVVMLVPTVLLGSIFPLVSRICTSRMEKLGMTIGNVYAVNTAGAIVGSFLAGFVLIPLIGVKQGMMVVASLNILVGLIVLGSSPELGGRAKLATVVATLAIFAIGVLLTQSKSLYIGIGTTADRRKILYYKEDLVANVRVEQTADDVFLLINNNVEAGRRAARAYQGMGHLAMLLHPDPRHVLLIGMGGGITAGAVARHPVEEIEIVELVPSLAEAASFFSTENHQVLRDSRTRLIIGDGRNFLLTTENRYDVIISEIFYPEAAGTGNLYSVEHYQLARRRLRDHGLMVQWLTLYQLSEEEFKVIAATFQQVFPHVELWLGDVDMMLPIVALIGTESRRTIDLVQLQERLARPEVSEEFAYGDDAFSLLASFVMSDGDLSQYLGDPPLNTDDRPTIEFSTPKNSYRSKQLGWETIQRLTRLKKSVVPLLGFEGIGRGDRERIIKRMEHGEAARTHFYRGTFALGNGRVGEVLQEYSKARSLAPKDAFLDFHISWNLGRLLARLEDWKGARSELEHALRIRPSEVDPRLRVADVYVRLGRLDLAEHHLAEAVRYQPEHAVAHTRLGEIYAHQGRWKEARRALSRALLIFPFPSERIKALHARLRSVPSTESPSLQ